jgi:hypothetical protein
MAETLCNSHQIFGGQLDNVDFGPNFLTVQQLTNNLKSGKRPQSP